MHARKLILDFFIIAIMIVNNIKMITTDRKIMACNKLLVLNTVYANKERKLGR